MNVLVTGANGQLGNEMRLMAQNSSHHYIFTDVEELDITDFNAILQTVKEKEIQIIFCLVYVCIGGTVYNDLNLFFFNSL